ncbi:MAG: beta-galactosidase, partial [Alistipes sp.]|nr:beta-galactosidase [Alistipes sp.]
LGRIGGNNIMIPTALAFGYLEPSKDYYFRVKTLDEPVVMDNTNGNYNDGSEDQPYPYTLTSERGGCAWSNLIKLSTDAVHIASENEILYEGFNDIMVANDYMNWAPGVVPDLDTTKPQTWDDYVANSTPMGYPEFLTKPASERKWTTQAFSKVVRCYELGLQDVEYAAQVDMPFNANAGSLEGWSWWSKKNTYGIFPIFGAMRIGQTNGTGNNGALLKTPVINSDKLLNNKGTKCIVTFKMAFSSGKIASNAIPLKIWAQHFRGPSYISEQLLDVEVLHPDEYASDVAAYHTSDADYTHYQRYFDMSYEVYLRNGDQIGFLKPTGSAYKGTIVIDDVKIEVVPGEYEQNNFVDDGVGTEPDDTNYDVYGLGELPISHWYTVEPWSYTNADGSYNDELTKARYQEMRDSGINVALYMGHSINTSIAEQKRILGICEQVGLKFIGQTQYGGNVDMIPQIKEQLATSPAYIGDYIYDEPKATMYDSFGPYVNEFLRQMPDKDVYINLYPTYSASLGTTNYESYIEEYLDKVPTKMLSYDYYGLMKNEAQIPSDYYLNLDLVRSKTLDRRMPFMVITQAGEVNSRKYPTEKEQRWTVWSTLAGGAKGISYFCYWTPSGGDMDDNGYMIDLEGNKTDMYDYIKRVNADINTIGKKLLPCHADGLMLSVTTNYSLFDNGGQGRTNYGPIKSVSAVENHVAVGCFRDARRSENGENYKGYKALVVARNPVRNIVTRLTLASSVTTITVTQNNTTKTVELNNLAAPTKVIDGDNGIALTYADGKLTLNIPEGEALLIEF